MNNFRGGFRQVIQTRGVHRVGGAMKPQYPPMISKITVSRVFSGPNGC